MDRIVGIDFGTKTSRVAVMNGRDPVIIENSEGQRHTPSCVAITESGDVLVGESAHRQTLVNVANSISNVKSVVGRRYDDPLIEPIKQNSPYNLINKHGDVWVELAKRPYSPEEICAFILRKLKQDAETYLGAAVTQAVIAVPSYFNGKQREAMKAAARLAGLETLRIISEPSAAALYYAMGINLRNKEAKTLVLYDLGSGGFSFSTVEIGGGVIDVRSTSGAAFVGGDDFDWKMISYVLSTFERENGVTTSGDKQALQRIKEAVERAKIELSSLRKAAVTVPFLLTTESRSKDMNIAVERRVLEYLIKDLVQRSINICSREIKSKQRVTVEQVNEVILIGGSTRIPLVADSLADLFSNASVNRIRQDDAVAIGAAIQAAIFRHDVKGLLLIDVTPFSLGIETNGGVFTPLIQRNTTIPTKNSRTFSTAQDNQTAVTIRVLEGEHELSAHNLPLGQFDLTGIARGGRGTQQIDVTFSIDASGILTVTAKDKARGHEISRRIDGDSANFAVGNILPTKAMIALANAESASGGSGHSSPARKAGWMSRLFGRAS